MMGVLIALTIQATALSSQKQFRKSGYLLTSQLPMPKVLFTISSASVSYLSWSSHLCFSSTFCSVWVLV